MAAANDRPQWLDVVLKLERAIGSRVESRRHERRVLRRSSAQANRARKRFSEAFEGVQEEWLHLFNLPAGTDVRRLREQLSRVERELEALTLELGDQDQETRRRPGRGRAKAEATPAPQTTSPDADE